MAYDPTRHHRRSIRLREYDYSLPGAYFVTICVRDRRSVFGEVAAGRLRHSQVGEVAHAFWANIPDHVPEVVLDAFVVMPNHVHGIIGIVDREPDGAGDVRVGGGYHGGGNDRGGGGDHHDGGVGNRGDDGNGGDGGNRGDDGNGGGDGNRRGVQLNASTMGPGTTPGPGTVPGKTATSGSTGPAGADTPGTDRSPFADLSPKRGTLSVIVRTYKGAVTRWCRQNGHGDFAWQPRFYDHIIRDARALHNIRRYIDENPMRWHLDKLNPQRPTR